MGITRIFQATVPRTSTCAGKYDIAPQASYLNLIEQDEFHCEIREPNSPSKNKKKKKKKKEKNSRRKGKITLSLKYGQFRLSFSFSTNILKLVFKIIDWSLSVECKRKLSKFACIAYHTHLKIIRRIKNPRDQRTEKERNERKLKNTKYENETRKLAKAAALQKIMVNDHSPGILNWKNETAML